jgi:diguanylate cyclase (GGDEF)-like protein
MITPRVFKDLKKRSSIGIIFYLIIAYVVLHSNNYYDRHPVFSNQFLFSVVFVCLFRFIHLIVSQRISSAYYSLNKSIFIFLVSMTGLVWGLGLSQFMIQDGEPETKLLMFMSSAGLCSGGAVAFIPSLSLSIAFSTFMLAPVIISLIVYNIDLPVMIMILLYLIYMVLMAKRGNKEYWDALENEQLLEKMSRTDSLTGLHNRRYFDQMFGFEWQLAKRNQTSLSAIICDIDHFKQVNDQFGHLAGDAYLEKIAKELQFVFRRATDVVARYGGEEFIVILPNESLDKVVAMAENVRTNIENLSLKFHEQQVQTTVSLGIATCVPQPSDRKELLISKADKALYQAKTSGRNKTIISE